VAPFSGQSPTIRQEHDREVLAVTKLVRPEMGASVDAGGIATNYLEAGDGPPVVLIHGSGPGVTAYANWRLTISELAPHHRVLAPDMAGFGFSDKPAGVGLQVWVDQIVDFMGALDVPRASLVGNSFGAAIALRIAVDHPDLVHRIVLMGAMGVSFPLTAGLDVGWGYEPSLENMRNVLDYFAYSRELVTDELAEVRYRAALEPGVQEAFSAMFPAPRQRWIDALATSEDRIRQIPHEALVVHGRDDQVIPLQNAHRLHALLDYSELHVFGRCGHWSQIEWAEDFNALLVRFFGRKDR
jgi:pimeloyl-ACP methyl ester carboxylesterase